MDDKNSVIETYKKQLSIFKSVGIIYLVALLIYYIITILNCQDFNLKAKEVTDVFKALGYDKKNSGVAVESEEFELFLNHFVHLLVLLLIRRTKPASATRQIEFIP